MSSRLCQICQAIPPRVWLSAWEPGDLPVQLPSPQHLENSAADGCYFCSFILTASNSSGSSGFGYGAYPPLTARGAELSKLPFGPAQDVSLTFADGRIVSLAAYVIPEPWCKVEPIQDLVQPLNNARIMREWLKSCVKNHAKCSSQSNGFVPSRLLHVDAANIGLDIRLVSTESFATDCLPDYIALSHCWGPRDKHPITTLKSNLEEHMACIPFAKLSNTFRDAVQVTRQLGISYLWIDSLCIVQQDAEDWAKEAALMAKVYECAYCTLSALSSHDSTGGCNQEDYIQGSTSPFTDIEVSRNNGGEKVRVRIFLNSPRSWNSEYHGRLISDGFDDSSFIDPADDFLDSNDTPLRLRAWTMQEKELSRRLVHFGKNQILWECRELKATAQLPWYEHSIHEEHAWKKDLGMQHVVGVDLNDPKLAKERWQHLVEDFTLRALTEGTDKLPAIGGLASQFQSSFPNSQYAAGIWTEHLPSSLLWKSVNIATSRHAKYVAPSWSWASLAGPITHQLGWIDFVNETLRPAGEPDLSLYRKDDGPPIEIEAHTTPKYADLYGMVTGGYIICKNAWMITVDALPNFTKWHRTDSTEDYDALTKDGIGVVYFQRDSADDITEGQKTFVLRIERDMGCCIHWRGLVLVQVSDSEGIYRRVGLAKCIRDILFVDDHVVPKTITII